MLRHQRLANLVPTDASRAGNTSGFLYVLVKRRSCVVEFLDILPRQPPLRNSQAHLAGDGHYGAAWDRPYTKPWPHNMAHTQEDRDLNHDSLDGGEERIPGVLRFPEHLLDKCEPLALRSFFVLSLDPGKHMAVNIDGEYRPKSPDMPANVELDQSVNGLRDTN